MTAVRCGALLGAAALAALPAAAALAGPRLAVPDRAAGLAVYADDARPDLFYYGPGDLVLATDAEGRPDARLLHVRYVGTRAAGDQGESLAHGLLSLTVRMDGPEVADLAAAAAELSPAGSETELRPLPIASLASSLVYARVEPAPGDAGGAGAGGSLGEGFFEDAVDEGSAGVGYWRERTYSLRLGRHDAQILWEALHAGRVALSLGYVFFARGAAGESVPPELGGHPELIEQVAAALGEQEDGAPTRLVAVKAGALAFALDLERWPGLAARHDLNERLPPGYPLLDVYCYDFREGRAEGVDVRRVELRAESPVGEPVDLAVEFDRSRPELYAHAVRFPFAARLDRPYRYRVTDIATDGSVHRGEWIERTSWARILDVSAMSNPEGAAPAVEDDDGTSANG